MFISDFFIVWILGTSRSGPTYLLLMAQELSRKWRLNVYLYGTGIMTSLLVLCLDITSNFYIFSMFYALLTCQFSFNNITVHCSKRMDSGLVNVTCGL